MQNVQPLVMVHYHYNQPYFTLPYHLGKMFLSPSTDASIGPNTRPGINHKLTKSPSVVLVVMGTGLISRTPALMGNYGNDPVFNRK